MALGLKNYKIEKRSIIWSLKNFCRELKYACQRFWRGYDDVYLYSLDYRLDELLPEILQWFRHNRVGSPMLENSTQETCHEDWNKILDEILYHFAESNGETCSEKNEFDKFMFGDFDLLENDMRGNYDKLSERYHKRRSEIQEYREQHHKRAYMMVAEHIDAFWD